MSQQYLAVLGVSLLLAGLALALISIIILLRSGKFRGSGGAVLLIGPIPIVIGSDRRITLVMLALTVVLIIIFVVGIFGSGL